MSSKIVHFKANEGSLVRVKFTWFWPRYKSDKRLWQIDFEADERSLLWRWNLRVFDEGPTFDRNLLNFMEIFRPWQIDFVIFDYVFLTKVQIHPSIEIFLVFGYFSALNDWHPRVTSLKVRFTCFWQRFKSDLQSKSLEFQYLVQMTNSPI